MHSCVSYLSVLQIAGNIYTSARIAFIHFVTVQNMWYTYISLYCGLFIVYEYKYSLCSDRSLLFHVLPSLLLAACYACLGRYLYGGICMQHAISCQFYSRHLSGQPEWYAILTIIAMCLCTKHGIVEAKYKNRKKNEINATHITLRIYDNKKKKQICCNTKLSRVNGTEWGFSGRYRYIFSEGVAHDE